MPYCSCKFSSFAPRSNRDLSNWRNHTRAKQVACLELVSKEELHQASKPRAMSSPQDRPSSSTLAFKLAPITFQGTERRWRIITSKPRPYVHLFTDAEEELMSAVATGDTRIVKVLIAAGADVAAKDNDG